ncbi:PP2C family protein-serine/threonine phosphatase [Streptomyces sp. NBC_00059]|uniref:PP2C family protein-serine/threonine phosphatase n=1 Tax=Streptomyces sp. NBC_00059 TaxID=2975635 RepID=UPI00224D43F6|nr:PP2C family protein-serine/threonine phosphatase [Streptomyces sp. NBC_00059]MCX5415988.1 serine/threonine-protein phosphatase [Streptomyces sp. NBC_00059]
MSPFRPPQMRLPGPPPGPSGRWRQAFERRLDRVVYVLPAWLRRRRVGWLLPLAALLAVAFTDWNTSGDFRALSWIVMVPGLAAALCPVWVTAVFGLVSVMAYLGLDAAWSHEYRAGLPDFILVAAGSVLAIAACWFRLRQESRILHIRNVADATRATVLRDMPPHVHGVENAHIYLPADAVARLGGDFYDLQPCRWGARALIGDVQGKGLGALAAAAAILGSFREAGYHVPSLSTVAGWLEVRMERQNRLGVAMGYAQPDRFATAVLMGFPNPGCGESWVDVVDFGHEPPLVVSPRGVRVLRVANRLPLGLSELDPAGVAPAVPHRFTLADDDVIVLTTDGVTEARNAAGEFFPLRSFLEDAVVRDPGAAASARQVAALVSEGLLRHSGGRLHDDTTIFALRFSATEDTYWTLPRDETTAPTLGPLPAGDGPFQPGSVRLRTGPEDGPNAARGPDAAE